MFAVTNRKDHDNSKILLPNWQIFILITIINLLITFWVQKLIYSREFYYSLLSEQMEISRIDDLIEAMGRYSYLGFVLLPVFLFLRFLITSLLLQLILLLKFIEIKFNRLFRHVMLSSLVIFAGQVIHSIRLVYSLPAALNRDLLTIKPLSLAGLLDTGNYPQSSLMILNHCGLFEILWMCCIYYGLLRTNRLKKEEAAVIVLILWSGMLFLAWAFSFYIEKFQ